MGAPRRLAIFDIDGTLTATNAVDDECYVRAAAEVFDLRADERDWSGAPHVTDAAIAHWLCSRRHARAPHEHEVARLVDRFVELLEIERAARPHRFAPIAGTPALLPHLRANGWDIALATGGWRASALLKLAAAALDLSEAPMACATDASTREEIVRLAHERSVERRGAAYDHVVSVGDGAWDVRTARNVGLPFVGVGNGDRALALRRAGATIVLPDLADVDSVSDALDRATLPVAAS